MKILKTVAILFFTFFCTVLVFGQGLRTPSTVSQQSYSFQDFNIIKTPDVANFSQVGYLPVNESTGKANLSIPLYTINFEGLEIPISLSYDTGGVKVNSASSRVGLNWTLIAGGMISKEEKGQNDLALKGSFNDVSPTGYFYFTYGYLFHLFNWDLNSNHPIAESLRDTQPDEYTAIAPSLYTKFIHQKNGVPFEIKKNSNIIVSPFQSSDFLKEPFSKVQSLIPNYNINYKFGFYITSTKGFIYSFQDPEYSLNLVNPCGPNYFPSLQNPWSISQADGLVKTNFWGHYIDYPNFEYATDPFSSIHLSQIKSPISNNKIEFKYQSNLVVDINRHIERALSSVDNSLATQTNYEHDYTKEKILEKIIFPGGIVDFIYEDNRLDLQGAKKLKKIMIHNDNGDLIKGIVFEQDYYKTNPQSFVENNLRLRLREINFFDANNNILPGYKFEYNNTILPERFSVNQDYSGYFNGNTGLNYLSYKPIIYFKANQGKLKYLPFPANGYNFFSGNASKLPNLIFAKAGALEKITYPTGAFTTFEFELPTFNFEGESKECGGLRIKSQSIFESDLLLKKKINYTYLEDNGLTSGIFSSMPTFVRTQKAMSNILITYNPIFNKEQVNYSRVKVEEIGNGYIVNKYTTSKDFPDILNYNYSLNNYTNIYGLQQIFEQEVLQHTYPNICLDQSDRRGQLISAETFDSSNKVIKSIENEYEYTIYNQFPISESIVIRQPNYSYNFNGGQFASFASYINCYDNHIKKITTKDYSELNVLSQKTEFQYLNTTPLINSKTSITSNSDLLKENITYSIDPTYNLDPVITSLNNLNFQVPIKRVFLKNNEIISSSLLSYQNFGNNKILPKQFEISKDINSFEVLNFYDKYDKKGNLIEFRQSSGTINTVLYGYNYSFKIAEISNASYNEVLTALGMNDIDGLQNLSNQNLFNTFFLLRNSLPNAKIISYTHKPLVGLLSQTNPIGETLFYDYDSFFRLKSIKV